MGLKNERGGNGFSNQGFGSFSHEDIFGHHFAFHDPRELFRSMFEDDPFFSDSFGGLGGGHRSTHFSSHMGGMGFGGMMDMFGGFPSNGGFQQSSFSSFGGPGMMSSSSSISTSTINGVTVQKKTETINGVTTTTVHENGVLVEKL